PTLDLDASAAGTGYAATSAAGAATAIVDSGVTIADVDNTELTSATITVTNHKTGDLLSIAGSPPAGISASSYNSSTGVLTLTGIGTLAQYQAVLQQLRFSNGESHPDITDRDITVTVSDGIASSNIAHSVISVTAPNEAPDAKPDSFTTTENGISGGTSSVPLAVGNVLTNAPADSDPDGDGVSVTSVTGVAVNETDLQLSTPVITSEAAGAGEAARFMITTTTGVAHLAVMATGAVNLWTTAGDAFQGLGTGESATLSFTYGISDGHGGTDTATAQITINGSNDTPTASNVVQAVADTLANNAGTVVANGNLVAASAAADPDGDTPLTISSIQGPTDGSAITVTAGGVVAHGTYGDLTVSSNGTYSYTAKPAFDALQTGNNPSEAFTFIVSDGHGGTTTQTLTFSLTGANDAPTGLDFILASGGSSADNGTTLNAHGLIGTFVATGDVDGGAFTYTLSNTGGLYGMDVVDGNATSNTTGNFYVGNNGVDDGTDTSFTVSVGGATFNAHVVVYGTGGDTFNGSGNVVDIVYGHNGNDSLNGDVGSDALIGSAGTDTLNGGAGNDQMAGGNNNDTYVFASSGNGNDRVDETTGGGTDLIQITTANSATLFTTLGFERVGNDLLITYNDSSITVTGQFSGATQVDVDSLVFTNGGTYLGYQLGTATYALNIDSTSPLTGTNSLDVVASSSTGETFDATNGNDMLFGNGGIDTINGGSGNDLLVGGVGNDILNGDADNDTLVGGAGADALNGGAGIDTFVYTAIGDSTVGAGNRDVITGFVVGTDKIRLIEIDANTALATDQAFTFVAAQNTGVVANSVTWHQSGGNTYVHGDVNGDGVADFEIELLGTHNLTSTEFNL
ncbi:beta strand repeat-containing protein, partial [Devosia sp. LjRoot16]|uniref:beta strand repeat-containing protein n=1 Tax=Devosia sp. LjRoot16 TaxID=3342271 RepID=UPI003F502E34